MTRDDELMRWVPALAFGILLLDRDAGGEPAARDPGVIGLGLAVVRGRRCPSPAPRSRRPDEGLWLLGPFPSAGTLWRTVDRPDAITGADWSAVLGQVAGIATAVFVAVIAALFNVSGIELMLRTDLDSNRELRDAGIVNVVSGAFGGIPGYHALSLTRARAADGRRRAGRGLRGGARPARGGRVRRRGHRVDPPDDRGRGARLRRASAFLVEWVVGHSVGRCPGASTSSCSPIFVTVAVTRGLLPGVVDRARARGRPVRDQLRPDRAGAARWPSGTTYRSNVDRPPAEREAPAMRFADTCRSSACTASSSSGRPAGCSNGSASGSKQGRSGSWWSTSVA